MLCVLELALWHTRMPNLALLLCRCVIPCTGAVLLTPNPGPGPYFLIMRGDSDAYPNLNDTAVLTKVSQALHDTFNLSAEYPASNIQVFLEEQWVLPVSRKLQGAAALVAVVLSYSFSTPAGLTPTEALEATMNDTAQGKVLADNLAILDFIVDPDLQGDVMVAFTTVLTASEAFGQIWDNDAGPAWDNMDQIGECADGVAQYTCGTAHTPRAKLHQSLVLLVVLRRHACCTGIMLLFAARCGQQGHWPAPASAAANARHPHSKHSTLFVCICPSCTQASTLVGSSGAPRLRATPPGGRGYTTTTAAVLQQPTNGGMACPEPVVEACTAPGCPDAPMPWAPGALLAAPSNWSCSNQAPGGGWELDSVCSGACYTSACVHSGALTANRTLIGNVSAWVVQDGGCSIGKERCDLY
jgi:hypothetical protein